MFTLSLEKLSIKDSYVAGNKAAVLGEIGKLGINIPRGFVLFSCAFDTFLNYHSLTFEIFSIISSIDFESEQDLNSKSDKIRKLIMRKNIPEKIENEIIEKYNNLKIKTLAVRASSLVEDSLKNSWAGQFKSILGSAEKTLMRDIKKVWASSFSSHILKYRHDNNLEKSPFSLAVIIQELLHSEVSGVSFSIDPFSNNTEVVLTEAIIGQGESLAYGKIIPNKYIVEKENGKLVDFYAGRPNKISSLMKKQGTLFESEQIQDIHRLLSQKEIETLSRYVIKLENLFNFPVDVEWLKTEKGEFYVVQARFVTTANRIKDKTSKNFNSHIKKGSKSLLALSVMDVWYYGEYFSRDKLGGVFIDPLFVYHPKKGFDIYYHKKSIKSNPIELVEYYQTNWNFGLRKEIDKFLCTCDELNKYLENFEEKNISKILDMLLVIWPEITNITTILAAVSRGACIDPEIKKILEEGRMKSEKIPHNAFKLIFEEAERYLDSKNISKLPYLSDFLTLEEIRSKKYKKEYPAILKQIEHYGSFAYYCGNVYFGEQMKQLVREKIKNNSTSNHGSVFKDNVFLGTSVYPGNVSGKVRKIFNYYDISKIEEGDVIVALDISPEYSKIIKKVAGIITEEGSELSHTAILARENKKPCIIGVQGIMKGLIDGQRIEMDGKKGSIKII